MNGLASRYTLQLNGVGYILNTSEFLVYNRVYKLDGHASTCL